MLATIVLTNTEFAILAGLSLVGAWRLFGDAPKLIWSREKNM